MKKNETQNKSSHPTTARGGDLRAKAEESQQKGEAFRAEHQGADAVKPIKSSSDRKK